MKSFALAAVLLGTLGSAALGPAWASAKCDVPKDEWRPEDVLQQKLEAKGWKIRLIKVGDGCYEVFGTDSRGKRKEVAIDPKSLKVVAVKDGY